MAPVTATFVGFARDFDGPRRGTCANIADQWDVIDLFASRALRGRAASPACEARDDVFCRGCIVER